MDRRIKKHPILGEGKQGEEVTVYFDGRPLSGKKGETVAATIIATGHRINRFTRKMGSPRGIFCGIGQCTDCVMVVNGIPNTRTCVTLVEDGMIIETQRGTKGGGAEND